MTQSIYLLLQSGNVEKCKVHVNHLASLQLCNLQLDHFFLPLALFQPQQAATIILNRLIANGKMLAGGIYITQQALKNIRPK